MSKSIGRFISDSILIANTQLAIIVVKEHSALFQRKDVKEQSPQ
ncbi:MULTISPECIES: hypothetical protein [Proteus]|nr:MULTISPECIES: hypothetical protein [Proteus]MDC9787012.1 hypothetical protein [Proteus mirabilis]MDH7533343.1 hypothetical protein [Proteus mirabilis]MDM3629219.1 hypothetical protein [Proteus mirabilis]MDM3640259.1 hypothetical protein [Proteus mirabilis]MDM3673576.1 hypothetical protein [Proteus mirabilis]